LNRLKTILKIVFSLGLAAFFLWSAFRTVDIGQVVEILRQTELGWLLATPAVVILATLPRAWRWKILMKPVLPDASMRKVFMAIIIGYAANNLIPRSGEIAKVWALDRNPDKLFGLAATVAVERLLDLVTVMVLFAFVTVMLQGRLTEVVPWLDGIATTATIVISLVMMVVIGISVYGDPIIDAAGKRFPKFSGSKVAGLVRSFLQGMEAVKTPGSYAGIVLWTLLLNSMYVLSLYLPFFAFGFTERFDLGLIDAVAVLTLATVGIIIPTPGGAGTYHYFCSRGLNGLFGVPLEEAVAYATVVHGLTYFSFFLLGGPSLISLMWNKRRSESN
jgi:uncharacterized protein (TIRG00374 family)